MSQKARQYISRIADLTLADRPLAGGKSASLGELIRAGVRVPPGFVVLTRAFDAFLRPAETEIRSEIAKLELHDAAQVAAASEQIRTRIQAMPVPDDIAETIRRHYHELSHNGAGCPVAVRSSATCEDSESASFAGLQDTYLWVRGEEMLIEQVRACWASLYNSESITYRRRLDLPEQQIAMAVVVQQMVDAKCAGVMFTRSPTTGDKSVIVIEASWGLGASLVSGEVTPDRFVINKVTGEVVKSDISDKQLEHVAEPSGIGVRVQAVDEARRRVPCLADDDLRELWQTARTVEQHYGTPQDIEWAICVPADSGKRTVNLLQSRPETVWAARDAEPAARPAAKDFDHVLQLLGAGKNRS
ncbi:MAG: PEP/pyruvate-binding domain-containing protein [Woeseiaceae bacterium]|nr:PEP/pyruvate-binding domain-containing protein [Woeseiaceae bacterium]